MSIAFARPTTLLSGAPLPPAFHFVADEALVSYECRGWHPELLSETIARFTLARRLAGVRPRPRAFVAGRYGELFALLRGLRGTTRPPLVLMDVEWHARSRAPLRRILSRVVHHGIAAGCSAIQVFCEAEVGRYAAYFGIPREKFVWLPFCMDLDLAASEVRCGDYVFTGGIFDRDYDTLFEAVEGLPVEVRVAGPIGPAGAVKVPANVKLLGSIARAEYFRQIAGAGLVALSLRTDDSLRFPGVITYCTAMHLGKCVVLNEPEGSASYIEPGVHGVVVAPGDPGALRAAISSVLEDPKLRERIGQAALAHARSEFTGKRYFERLEQVLGGLGAWEAVPAPAGRLARGGLSGL